MTIKLYDEYPYETEFTATVLSCESNGQDGFDLIPDRTLFFPEEGGQTCDQGVLLYEHAEFPVLDVQIRKDGSICHTIAHPIPKGTQLTGRIDWQHRFSNMQNHTGEHICSGIAHSRFGCENVGFHLSDSEMTIDYNNLLSAEEIASLESAVNEAIFKDLPVRCYYPDPETLSALSYRSKKEIDGPVRIVEIEGIDTCACCAPHVSSTGQAGLFKILSQEKWKGGTRLYAICGFRALEEFRRVQEAAAFVSREYSVPVEAVEFQKAIFSRNEAISNLRKKHESLQKHYLEAAAEAVPPEDKNLILFVEGLDDIAKRELLNRTMQERRGFCAIFDGTDENGYSFIAASAHINCNEVIAPLKEAFGARGGGKPVMVQGSLKATRKEITEKLEGR